MRRRSSIVPSVIAAPVREDEVLGSVPNSTRHSFAPRQLTFEKNKTADSKLGKRRSNINVRASIYPSSTAKSNESVLAETILEDDCSIAIPQALHPHVPHNAAIGKAFKGISSFNGGVSIQPKLNQKSNSSNESVQSAPKEDSTIPKPKANFPESELKSTSPSKQQSQTAEGSSTLTNKNVSMDIAKSAKAKAKWITSARRSNLSETKIPKPKILSASKSQSAESQLNSTAAFEEVEIEALTSTPHPERSTRRRKLLSADSDLQVNLFLSEQRSVMQAMKLSFQKLNLVLDSQLQVNLETTNLLRQIKESHGSFQFNPMSKNPLNSTEFKDNLALLSTEKISIACNTFESDKLSFKKMLSPCQEDKENVASERPFKPEFLYRDMKSQLACLKTPTTVKKSGPMCAETPNTYLSNAVHHQLESLFDDSEMLKK